jgi:aminoglycoside 2'-N-acetyltransferase I
MSEQGAVGQATIELKEGAALTKTEWAAIIALCDLAFAEDFSRYFAPFARSWHVLVRQGGALVSHACWVERWLQPAGLPLLRTAYIEAVATHPAWQRRGYGTLAMTRLAEEIVGYDLGALSPAAAKFYERLGWEGWRGPTAIRTDAGLLPTPDEEIMILRLLQTPPLDPDAAISAEWREGEVW